MRNLNHQQIKQQELKLLQTGGFSLAEYGQSDSRSKLFKDLPSSSNYNQLERLKISTIKSAGLSINANLNAFCFALLHSIYRHQIKEDLLDLIKSSFYNPEMDLTTVKYCSISNFSNSQMKKLVVEFFYSLAYSDYEDKVYSELCKYPIVLELLVLFMRKILVTSGVVNADNSQLKVPTIESYNILIEYFDLNCRYTGTLFLFYEDKIFILQTPTQEMMVGTYAQNQSQNNAKKIITNLGLAQLQEEAEQDTQKDQNLRHIQNPSLQIQGHVSESIVFSQQEASTPFFNLQQHNSSFSNSIGNNSPDPEKINQRQSLMKSSKEMSLLKMIDSKIQKNVGTFGNMNGNVLKKTMMQNELKKDNNAKQSLQMDSPITLDSPNTLCFNGNFDSMGEQANEKVKRIKKSKSQSRLNKSIAGPTKQKIPVKKKTYQKKKKHHCECVQEQKQKNKIMSNLYQINITYVPHRQPNFHKKQIHQHVPQNKKDSNLIKSLKTITSQEQIRNPQKQRLKRHQLKYVKGSAIRQNPNLVKNSISCSLLPRVTNYFAIIPRTKAESDFLDKRQTCSISVSERQKSFSPYSNVSVSKPKITFTYINRSQKSSREQQPTKFQCKNK